MIIHLELGYDEGIHELSLAKGVFMLLYTVKLSKAVDATKVILQGNA